MTFCRPLANSPKYSFRFSGSFARSTPSARNASVTFNMVVLPTWQSLWPISAISLPPLTAQASVSERIVLLSGPVMILPALRSEMNCSSGTPSISGMSRFRRGSMHVSATMGSASANSAGFNAAFAPAATARWFASTMASNRRIGQLSFSRPSELFPDVLNLLRVVFNPIRLMGGQERFVGPVDRVHLLGELLFPRRVFQLGCLTGARLGHPVPVSNLDFLRRRCWRHVEQFE